MRRSSLLPVIAACAFLTCTSCSKGVQKTASYAMGQRVEIGRLIYTVFETSWMTQLGEGLSARVPQHRFFLVRLSIANSGSAEQLAPNMTIEDDNGTTYAELTNGEGVAQWVGFLRQVKPAEALQGYVVFDAPPRHYRLRVSDENETKVATIDIPLTFVSEAPTTELPAAEQAPGAAKR
jgi:hypothetical protein